MLQNILIKKITEYDQLQKQQFQFQRSDQAMLIHDSTIIKFNDFSEEMIFDSQFNMLIHDLVADIDLLFLRYYKDAP